MHKVALVAVDIRSSHNIGAFFRTCDGFNASLFLTGISPRPLGGDNDDRLPYVAEKANKNISKTALGAENTVEWKYFKNAQDCIEHLKNQGYKILAIEQSDKSQDISKLPASGNIALLVGPEVDGLDKTILDECDAIYEIPMSGSKESFNVSVAAAIGLYQARAV